MNAAGFRDLSDVTYRAILGPPSHFWGFFCMKCDWESVFVVLQTDCIVHFAR